MAERRPVATARPRLLFVHGACHGAWCWEPYYLPFFRHRGYEVEAVDLRGHGRRRQPGKPEQAGLDDYVLDVLDRAQDRPVLIGHSMGAAVVQLVVERHPQSACAAVLLAPAVPGGLTLRERLTVLSRPRPVLGLLRLQAGKTVSTRTASRLPFFDGRLSPEVLVGAARRLQPESPRALADVRRFRPAPSGWPIPGLVVGSRDDRLFGPRALVRTAQRYGLSCSIVSEGCHDLMLDPSWERSASVIADWLDLNVVKASDRAPELR